MTRQRRHILAGILWVVASVVAWIAILNGIVDVILIPLESALAGETIEIIGNTYNVIAFAGAVLIPIAVGILAIRARLPWTGDRASRCRGFAVQPPRGMR